MIIKLPISLISKLGSVLVHLQEHLSPRSHEFDIDVLRQLLVDPEVESFLKDIDPALLPVRREPPPKPPPVYIYEDRDPKKKKDN